MGRVVRYPILLHPYLGRLWQATNRHGFALDPLRVVLANAAESSKIVTIEVRGPRGSIALARSADGYFPEPRAVWLPGERLVVEIDGTPPLGVSVVAGRKEVWGC